MRYPQIQINPLLFFLLYPNSRKRSEVIEGAKGGEVEKNLREELEKVLFKRVSKIDHSRGNTRKSLTVSRITAQPVPPLMYSE